MGGAVAFVTVIGGGHGRGLSGGARGGARSDWRYSCVFFGAVRYFCTALLT